MESIGGVKRPAVESPVDAEAAADDRPAQQPRLEVLVSESEGVPAAPPDAAAADIGCYNISIDLDLLCQIASFMRRGEALTNLCIATGPSDAAKIRYEYLRDSDAYVVTCLKPLDELRLRGWYDFEANLKKFDKCRDGILAWMAVNDDWNDRCTAENMERCKDDELHMEANLVFNNPAVAAEIGLLEVLRFFVDQNSVGLTDAIWPGFNSRTMQFAGIPEYDHLVEIALIRGDPSLLEFILSHDDFDTNIIVNYFGYPRAEALTNFATTSTYVNDDCFKIFIRHPKVNLNIASNLGRSTVLIGALDRLPIYDQVADLSTRKHVKSKVEALLDAGADPHFEIPDQGFPVRYRTPIEYARRQAEEFPDDPLRKELLRKMEMWGLD